MFAFSKLHCAEILHAFLGLFERVKGQGRVMFRFLVFVVELRIFFLQVAGIGKNDAAQIDRSGRGVYGSAKPFFHQPGNPSAVIEMSVGENYGVDLAWGHRRLLPVALTPFVLPLEHPAINKYLETVLAFRI